MQRIFAPPSLNSCTSFNAARTGYLKRPECGPSSPMNNAVAVSDDFLQRVTFSEHIAGLLLLGRALVL